MQSGNAFSQSSLVHTEAASSFLQLAGTDAGRAAFLGDESQLDSGVGSNIVKAKIALRDSAQKVSALVIDPTRTEVAKHEAAQQLAARTIATLTETKAAIESRAETLYDDGVAQAEREFAPRASHSSLESEIRGWIREQASKADGMPKIRAAMLESKDVATVIFHSPGFLVGISNETHIKMRFDATERWLPDAYKRMTDSIALRELAPKYDKAINSVRSSFYNGAIAAQASKRVEI